MAALALAVRTVPARLLLAAVAVPAPLVLTEVEGRWWDVGLRIGVGDARGGAPCMLPGRFAVRLAGIGWQTGPQLRLELHSEAAAAPLRLRLARQASGWSLSADAWDIALPVDCLASLGAPFNTLAPQGLLLWRNEALSIESAAGRGWRPTAGAQGSLRVIDAASAVAPLRPLGSYVARWRAVESGEVRVDVSTEQGPLVIEGAGSWLGARLRFEGRARARADAQDSLANLLAIIGRRDPADAAAVTISF